MRIPSILPYLSERGERPNNQHNKGPQFDWFCLCMISLTGISLSHCYQLVFCCQIFLWTETNKYSSLEQGCCTIISTTLILFILCERLDKYWSEFTILVFLMWAACVRIIFYQIRIPTKRTKFRNLLVYFLIWSVMYSIACFYVLKYH